MFHDPQHHQRFEKYISTTEIDKYTEAWRFAFSAFFRQHEHSVFEDKRPMKCMEPNNA